MLLSPALFVSRFLFCRVFAKVSRYCCQQLFDRPVPVPRADEVPVADVKGLSSLFGVSIYSFMCHHSLPSLVTPMSSKRKLNTVMVADFALIMGFYCLLCFTAMFRFDGKYSSATESSQLEDDAKKRRGASLI